MASSTSGARLIHTRRWSRRLAMQALYQWQITGQDIREIMVQFHEDENFKKADSDYFSELLHGIPASINELDSTLRPLLSRPVDEIDHVERAILRSACFELLHRIDVPPKVVINEAINLAKKFGAAESYRFINGVLDKLMSTAPRGCSQSTE